MGYIMGINPGQVKPKPRPPSQLTGYQGGSPAYFSPQSGGGSGSNSGWANTNPYTLTSASPTNAPAPTGQAQQNQQAPYENPSFAYGQQWKNPYGLPGLGWKADWKLGVPGDDEKKAQTAHFLNWFNRVLPYLSPLDATNMVQQVTNALNKLESKDAWDYFRPLLMNISKLNRTIPSTSNYWTPQRLQELRAASNAYWQEVSGGKPLQEWEEPALVMTNLFDIVSGLQRPGGEINNPGIWPGGANRPMTRRERMAYMSALNTTLSSLGDESPYKAVLEALFKPTTAAPVLSTGILSPQNFTTGFSTSTPYFRYSIANPRYIGY